MNEHLLIAILFGLSIAFLFLIYGERPIEKKIGIILFSVSGLEILIYFLRYTDYLTLH